MTKCSILCIHGPSIKQSSTNNENTKSEVIRRQRDISEIKNQNMMNTTPKYMMEMAKYSISLAKNVQTVKCHYFKRD